MTTDDYGYRFGGMQRLYGVEIIEAFKHAHVCIIGIGGVGSWAAEAIARSGIGQITLIDLDDICVSNTNRQIHADNANFGKLKVTAMAERIALINPQCKVNAVARFVSEKNLAECLTSDMDYVIDAIDSVKAKTSLLAYCKRQKIKVVTVGGAGGQKDPTRIEVADLSKAYQDPLLAKVRSRLRKDYGFSNNPKRKFSIECVFSSEQLTYPPLEQAGCEVDAVKRGPVRLDCATGFGAAVCVTASFGLFAASRVLNKLAERTLRSQA